MGGTGVIDRFLETFTRYIDSGFGLLGSEVGFLATTLTATDITLAALFWAWGTDEDIVARLVRKTLFVGVFAYLIGNWNNLARIVFESFAGLGLKASGTGLSSADFLRPGRIAQVGIDAGRPILDSISGLMGYISFFENFVQISVLLFAWIIVLLAFFIPAALITGIRSDQPGQITAQVTENIFDSPTGRAKLVPQGARLIGVYDSQVAFGQSRVLLVWTRLIMPNGRSIVLERQAGADTSGFSGLEDEVDNHLVALFKAALLSTLLGVGTELGSSGNDNDIIQALRRGAGDSLQTGQQVVRRNLNIQPTLTIRPGF